MNTYKISGADRMTGAERTVVLEAADEKAAAIAASKDHNLLVAKMKLVPLSKGIPPQIPMAANDTAGSLNYAGPTTPPLAAMPPPPTVGVIEHVHRIDWQGFAMELLGGVLLLAGCITLAFAAVDYNKYSDSRRDSGVGADLASGLAFRFAATGAANGLLLLGVGAICIHLARAARRPTSLQHS